MLAETQNEMYFERMKSSLGDKASMIPYLNAGQILDVGAGGGEFAALLAENPAFNVIALDGSREAINHCVALGVTAVEGYTHQISELLPPAVFDTIVCSSIIHEIYSYGRGVAGTAHTLGSVQYSFDQFNHVLKPGGHIVIRDGIIPDNWDTIAEVTMLTQEGMAAYRQYMNMIPFQGTAEPQIRKVFLQVKPGTDNILVGTMESVMEFLYTYTWGVETFPRETQELYGVFTLNEYVQFLETNDFTVLHAEEYLQPGYPEHLKNKAEIRVNGKLVEFPNSNCLIAVEKKEK